MIQISIITSSIFPRQIQTQGLSPLRQGPNPTGGQSLLQDASGHLRGRQRLQRGNWHHPREVPPALRQQSLPGRGQPSCGRYCGQHPTPPGAALRPVPVPYRVQPEDGREKSGARTEGRDAERCGSEPGGDVLAGEAPGQFHLGGCEYGRGRSFDVEG